MDAAVFGGQLANYTIAKSSTGYTITAISGADGADTVVNIEAVQLADVRVNLLIQAQAAAHPNDAARIIELYLAFFRRVPEADGLSYWLT